MRIAAAAVSIGLAVSGGAMTIPVAAAHPSDPGVVSYAVLGRGSVGNIVGGPMGWESVFSIGIDYEYWEDFVPVIRAAEIPARLGRRSGPIPVGLGQPGGFPERERPQICAPVDGTPLRHQGWRRSELPESSAQPTAKRHSTCSETAPLPCSSSLTS